MSVQYAITTGQTALVAATAKTMIEVATGTSVAPSWIAVDITFDGITGPAVPVRVDFLTYSASGTGTTYTPKRIGGVTGVAVSTAKINDTVEPATPTILFSWFVPPTSGVMYQFPLGREVVQGVSTFMGIRLTAPAVVNAIVNLFIEE